MEYIGWTISFVIFCFIAWLTWHLHKAAEILNQELNKAEKEAKSCDNLYQVDEAWKNLQALNNRCWHRHHASRIREIKAILETKQIIFSKDGDR